MARPKKEVIKKEVKNQRVKSENKKKEVKNQRVKSENKKEVKEKKTRAKKNTQEEVMSRTSILRMSLIGQRNKIREDIKKDIKELVKEKEDYADDIDIASVDASDFMLKSHLDIKQKMLTNIVEALRKLDDGCYGICDECGEEIPIKRLEVVPFTSYCIDCKTEIEREDRQLNNNGLEVFTDSLASDFS